MSRSHLKLWDKNKEARASSCKEPTPGPGPCLSCQCSDHWAMTAQSSICTAKVALSVPAYVWRIMRVGRWWSLIGGRSRPWTPRVWVSSCTMPAFLFSSFTPHAIKLVLQTVDLNIVWCSLVRRWWEMSVWRNGSLWRGMSSLAQSVAVGTLQVRLCACTHTHTHTQIMNNDIHSTNQWRRYVFQHQVLSQLYFFNINLAG